MNKKIWKRILGWRVGDKCAILYPTFGVKAYGSIVEIINEHPYMHFNIDGLKCYHVAVVKLTRYPWKPMPERIIVPIKWLEEV